MMYAIGMPAEPPRLWVETSTPALAAAQLLPGEVIAPATLDADGRPVAEPLPTE